MAVLNWSAVCRVKDDFQSLQSQILGIIMNQQPASMGICVLPEFSYKRNHVWRSQMACLEALSNAALIVDHNVSLTFEGRKDPRDSRPLVYQSRVLQGMTIPDAKWLFGKCKLVRDGRTDAVPQLASGNMVFIEDGDSLPATTDADGNVSGSKKYEQLGCPAYVALLQGAVQGVDLTAQHGLVVVDVNLGVGDLFEAWLQVREESSFSTVFVGLTDDASVRDYFFKSQTDKLVTLHLEKKFNIPGSPPMDLEPPSSRVLQQPSLPQLNVLVAKGLVPTIPEQLDKDWGNHPTFGKEWSKLLDDMVDEFGPAPAEEGAAVPPVSKKRRTGDAENGSAVRKVAVTETLREKLQPQADVMSAGILAQCDMVNQKAPGLKLVVRQGQKAYAVNTSGADVKLNSGTILAGYGKGAFRFIEEGEPPSKAELEYTLNATQNVVFNSKIVPLKDVVNKQRLKVPTASINYFSLKEDPQPEDPGNWTVQVQQRLCFTPALIQKEESSEILQLKQVHAAAVLPANCWAGVAEVMFVVRWANNGLMPVRPQVMLVQDVVIPAGQALALSKDRVT